MEGNRRILFLCTGNSCRSQIAEALLRHLGADRFEALSAGSDPAGFVHGLALDAIKYMNLSVAGLESKSWNQFADVPVDVVITLCDNAAARQCPVWSGSPITVHWPLPDPAYHPAKPKERFEFTLAVANRLREKIGAMVRLDWSADRHELTSRLEHLGEI